MLNVQDHKNDPQNVQLVTKAITYSNSDEGKVFGNGLLYFQYRGHNFFFITFSYRIYVKSNQYRYVFTDFNVKEVYEVVRGKSKINSFPLEEFINRKRYWKSDKTFTEGIKNLRHQLKLAMLGQL
jgi:hypothetical protein